MKNTDKYLILIVVGVVVLLVAVFSIALLRPKPAYQPENTPEGIANNYPFALKQDDYERAYGYLSPDMKHYPDSVDVFTENIRRYSWRYDLDDNRSPSLLVESAQVHQNRATVTVRETRFYSGGLFRSGESRSTFEMTLVRDAKSPAGWKIASSESYWAWCWESNDGCQ